MTAGWCATDPEAAVRGGSSATTAYCGLVVTASSSCVLGFSTLGAASRPVSWGPKPRWWIRSSPSRGRAGTRNNCSPVGRVSLRLAVGGPLRRRAITRHRRSRDRLTQSGLAQPLVLGTRGRSGFVEMVLGSVSLTVAAHADCPVIVLRDSHDNQVRAGERGRVFVGGGENGTESAALRFAVQEARLRGATLDAVRAWRCPAQETTDHPLIAGEPARLREQHAAEVLDQALKDAPADVELWGRTVEGPARRVLLAASHKADLLVVAARRNPRGTSGSSWDASPMHSAAFSAGHATSTAR